MNVLSLFDGISCGMVALERAGIKVDKYFNWKSNYWETSIMNVQNGVVNKKDIDKIK